MTPARARVALVTFGTRGDVLPFCVLGRELAARGFDVRFVTNADYHERVRRAGCEPVDTGEGFAELARNPEFEALFGNKYFSFSLASGPATARQLLALRRRIGDRVFRLALVALDEIGRADLVVYNAFAFFAGAFARECGRPAVRVICQPLLPSRREPLSVLTQRPLGALGNRLSYEALRPLSLLAAGALRKVRRRRGVGRGMGRFSNPLTVALRDVHHVTAYSPALCPDPGDWPVEPVTTGAWYARPEPGSRLQDHLEAFLAAGPPPIYVGFGSMIWGAARNTRIVLSALEQIEGRAILNVGSGGLNVPPSEWAALLPKVQPTTYVDHTLLFPRVAAVVHHGGAGTTAAVLRAGRPSVVLPHVGDQLFWGRRVAAVGAAEAPIPLGQITAADLAGRIRRACADPGMAAAAAAVAIRMAGEPGVAAAADFVESLLNRESPAS